MKAYDCPACGRASFSFWRVQFLGPGRSLKCPACGARASVPWLLSTLFGLLAVGAAWLGGLCALVLLASSGWSSASGFAAVVVLGAIVVTAPVLWLYGRVIYLVAR